MTNNLENQKSKGERTLLISLLLSAPGPVVTGISVLLGYSTTQIADFLRRSTELVAIFVSWWTYRKLQQNNGIDGAEKARLERLANVCVGGAMGFSGVIMLIIAAFRVSSYEPGGNVAMGLVIAVLGVLTNTWFWFRYRALVRKQFNAVIAVQQKLYRAKSFVDFCVTSALAAVAIAPAYPITRYVDTLGSIIVACYLMWNGFCTIRKVTNSTMTYS